MPITIAGRIARHSEPVFWGRITIDDNSGFITLVERGENLQASHVFGADCIIFAGLGDVHDHFREDNTGKQNYKEDYTTGADAALNGGVVHASAMPNTPEPITGGQQFHWHRNRVRELNHPVVILNYIGIDGSSRPLGNTGEYPYKCYFGKSVGPLSVIFASELDTILSHYRGEYVSLHVEYEPIVIMHADGKTHSDRRPVECVYEGLRLLLPLIEKYRIKAKLCHWSVGGDSFSLIEEYRARGCEIELEVSPLHLWFDTSMTDKDPSLWTTIQMNPAIQGLAHKHQLLYGLKTGFIQYLATDHAPHTEEEKFSAFASFSRQFPGKSNREIAEIIRGNNVELFHDICCRNNHSGAPWLDTYGPICVWLMKEHAFMPEDIARVAAFNPGNFVNRFLPAQFPGRNFGKGFGEVAEGFMGSLTVLNTNKPTVIERPNLKSKVGWSPLEGETLPGTVEAVFIEGKRY